MGIQKTNDFDGDGVIHRSTSVNFYRLLRKRFSFHCVCDSNKSNLCVHPCAVCWYYHIIRYSRVSWHCVERVTAMATWNFEPRNCIEQFISSINRSLKCSSWFFVFFFFLFNFFWPTTRVLKRAKKKILGFSELCSSGSLLEWLEPEK